MKSRLTTNFTLQGASQKLKHKRIENLTHTSSLNQLLLSLDLGEGVIKFSKLIPLKLMLFWSLGKNHPSLL